MQLCNEVNANYSNLFQETQVNLVPLVQWAPLAKMVLRDNVELQAKLGSLEDLRQRWHSRTSRYLI